MNDRAFCRDYCIYCPLMDSLEQAWLAGLLEGEGSFMCGPPSKPNLPVIHISTTDKDIIDRVGAIFGTKPQRVRSRKAHWKQAYACRVKGKPARELMESLRPLMGHRRREQIDAALASWDPHYRYRTRALTYAQAKDAKALLAGGKTRKEVATQFDVSYDTISALDAGRAYADV